MSQAHLHKIPPLSEHDVQLCDIFGREARLHFDNANWADVCQRLSLHWEALRRSDEPSWAVVRSLVQRAFERAGAECRIRDA
jgi:hypothetical protein